MQALDYLEIANRIKQRRESLGYSYQKLADLASMSKSTLQRYETGSIRNIPIARLRSLSAALNMDVSDLIGISSTSLNAQKEAPSGKPKSARRKEIDSILDELPEDYLKRAYNILLAAFEDSKGKNQE